MQPGKFLKNDLCLEFQDRFVIQPVEALNLLRLLLAKKYVVADTADNLIESSKVITIERVSDIGGQAIGY
jgi:hypothetical protein